jgi:diaminopropionate ammonia-lyase
MTQKLNVFINATSFSSAPVTPVDAFSHAELSRALAFHRSIPGYAPTPLFSLPRLSRHLGIKSLCVKDESARFGLKAFKVLGGAYAMARHIGERVGEDIGKLPFETIRSDKVRKSIGEVVFATTTDGNHGRGVAWTARQLKQKAVVYMPKGSSEERLAAIRREGAQAAIVDMNYDEAVRMTAAEAKKNGWLVVQDTAWPGYEKIPLWIMQGYGSLMLEAMQQLHEVPPTHIFIQAGVGSLAGTVQGMVASAWGQDRPKVIVAEAAAADCLYRSSQKADGDANWDGNAVAVGGDLATVMAGLACGEANSIGWNILRDYSAAFASCPDFVATRGMRILGNPLPGDPAIVSGESGAVTTGLLSILMQSPAHAATREALGLNEDSRVLVVSTEGDTDPQRYRDIVWDGEFPSYRQF